MSPDPVPLSATAQAGLVAAGRPPGPEASATIHASPELSVSRAMGVVVVTPHGHLGASEGAALEDVLVDLIEDQGNLKVVLDARDVVGLGPSSLEVLVAAADAEARLGGELTFADPSEAGAYALRSVGLGEAITSARQCDHRPPLPDSPGQREASTRRSAMSEHPAGTHLHRDQSRSFATPPGATQTTT